MGRGNEKKKDRTGREKENETRKKLRGQPGIPYGKAWASTTLNENKREMKENLKGQKTI